ncbi:hypothetical protein EGX35_14505 [Clavibacter nebraskensis]|uniref:Conserved membrane protein n=3 Tax=Clavibacter nebraskensis TaxID=31963 RepID=A0AAI8ZKV5_9MICO|nr:hypothetical protein VV38_14135 [Clavibacter nebraskensis]CCE76847.1 conserved membrane protein [Clavibacter nebraskensis NCPPB 2581]OAH19755.1 hypothetical protein A3Q38_07545 [Clavibacter nebraskensis]QGV67927.1 hypothetical protein EGX36_14550 [Clavibacter nebraskensis]QGV70726.1 hypothetical protein EGX37_14505 [Clavibacter nebraskensis]
MSEDELTFRAAYWPVLLLRALPALALGAFITFSSDHSPALGLVAFGVFAILSGLITTVLGARALRGPAARLRMSAVAQGAITVVAGVAALLARGGGVLVLLYVVSIWAVVTGFLELVAGLRSRGRVPGATDAITAGALTVVLAVAFLLVPPDLVVQYGGVEQREGQLTAPVVAVGLLGAYAAIVGVFLVIAALSMKWGTSTPTATSAAAAPTTTESAS